jgi:hypothetical protein
VAERDRRGIAAVLAADADLESGRVLRPRSIGDAHHRADAVAVEDLERVRGMIFCSTYLVRKLFCASSREMPRIVW